VLTKLMDLLRFNPWLIEIDLLETPLEWEGAIRKCGCSSLVPVH
jgi:hypothetical protein